ncbi:MAG: hypothetical protein C0467_27625 [Planctomycetaceae bacterium]|nr:hypothetical protein [Planctomycetaceae bacterium]
MSKKNEPKKVTKPASAKQKSSNFPVRVAESPQDAVAIASGVVGTHRVMFPKTKADVAEAVTRSRNLRTLVRSGLQAAATDAVDVSGGVVIHLAGLNGISVKKDLLSAEAGATTGAVAERLWESDLALPLTDNSQKSIASSVLGDGPSSLIRTLGPLSTFVSKLTGVTPAGEQMTRSGVSALDRARADNAVITGISFKPVPAKPLWMFRKSFPYPGKAHFAVLLKSLFMAERIPPQTDVVVDAISARHDIPVVRITAAGYTPKSKTAATQLVDRVLSSLPAEINREVFTDSFTGSDVIQTLVDAGPGIPLDPEVDAVRINQVVEPQIDMNGFLDGVSEDVDRGLAFRDDGKGKVDEGLRVFTRLQLNREDQLALSGIIYTPRPAAPPPVARFASLALTARTELPLHEGFGLELFRPAPIPNFRGAVHTPSDLLFEFYSTQYATSSKPRAEMTPFMVAYPRDEADIKAALVFAKSKGKRVVARSGGHQYSGMSSGGDGTIVLAMDRFAQFVEISENVFEVGPAYPLTKLAAKFKDKEVTIPHGECPLVCIGGHAQTGGFGHLLRAFGLTLDYVKAFTIILADGSVRTLQRPAGAPVTEDDELFWGVLGGNAGSFGIVTNYRFECIKDSDHPHSYGYAAARKYSKQKYKNLMKQVRGWTQGVAAGTLLADIDFMMTVESRGPALIPPFPTILVDLVHSNLGGSAEVVNGDQVFNSIIQASDDGIEFWELPLKDQGPKHLSDLSDSFVRRPPLTTFDGREFSFPYKKRINCTTSALTDVFIDKFVDMIDKVVTATPGVYLVFQMLIGGGNFQKTSKRAATSIPRRDFVYCFIFDLFYSRGKENVAVQLQTEMEAIVGTDYSPGQEQKLFWGSFGDPDITKQDVRNCYYDDATFYPRLQQLKQKVDPGDLFHSLMTVKLP